MAAEQPDRGDQLPGLQEAQPPVAEVIDHGTERLGTQASRRVQPVGAVQVEGHHTHPSVDAAHAVDGYLLDEQLIYDGDVLIFPVAGIITHFIKPFLANEHKYLCC